MSTSPSAPAPLLQTKFAVAFSDPCALDENPGWPLRNLLVLIAYHFAKNDMVLRIIALRKTADKSITFEVTVPMLSDETKAADGET